MDQNILIILLVLTMCDHCDVSLASKSHRNLTSLKTQLSYGRQFYDYEHRVKWLCFNASEEYDCCQIKEIHCFKSGPALPFGYCATYSENNSTKSLSIAKCPYFEWSNYNETTPDYITLPVSLNELNDYMCGPLNRKGLLCRVSECADGFGHSVTSYGPTYKCANCTNAWYHIATTCRLCSVCPNHVSFYHHFNI